MKTGHRPKGLRTREVGAGGRAAGVPPPDTFAVILKHRVFS